MSKHLSINQRLDKAKNIETKREILHDWLDNLDADIKNELRQRSFLRVEVIVQKFVPAMHKIIDKIESMVKKERHLNDDDKN